MPQREEMEIMLRDSITPGLRSIARELRALNHAAKESGTDATINVGKFGKSFSMLNEASSSSLKSMTAMGAYIVGFGKTILGIGGTVETIKKLSEGINSFAENRQQLTLFSQDTKLAAKDVSEMRDAMELAGIGTDQANKSLATFTDRLQNLRAYKQGSPIFLELEKMGDVGTQFGQRLLDTVKSGDYKKAIEEVLEFYKKETPEVQYHIQQAFGIPASVFDTLINYQHLVRDTFDGSEEKAKQYVINKGIFFQRLRSEWNLVADHVIETINNMWSAVNSGTENKHWLSDTFKREWDQFVKDTHTGVEDIKTLIDLFSKGREFGHQVAEWYRPAQPMPSGSLMGQALGGTAATFEDRFSASEEMRLKQEDTQLLTEIRDSLLGRQGYGAQSATYGQGIRTTGGAAQATGGGFRPRGGVRGARDPGYSYAGGETPDLTGLGGSDYLKAQRAPMMKELEEHPELKRRLAALVSLEDPKYGTMVVESLFNRLAYVNEERRRNGLPPLSVRDMIAPNSPRSFYGPERRHEVDPRMSRLTSGELTDLYRKIDIAGSSNLTQGFTDQGTVGDPNYITGGSGITMPNRERFNDWGGGPGAQAGARRFRLEQQRRVLEGRRAIDESARGSSVSRATVSVDFGDQNTAQGRAESALGGGPFLNLKIQRENQAQRSGSPMTREEFNNRWIYQ